MSDQALLRPVSQSGLCIGGETVPIVSFRHGQPGRRFVVCPEERGWRIHVRTTDAEAIRNAYREHAATRPSRQSRPRQKKVITVRPSAAILYQRNPKAKAAVVLTATSKDPATLLEAERRELECANALAVQLVEMKTRLMNGGRTAFADKGLLRVQELHARHLDRCMRLRSLLSDEVRGRSQACLIRSPNQSHRSAMVYRQSKSLWHCISDS